MEENNSTQQTRDVVKSSNIRKNGLPDACMTSHMQYEDMLCFSSVIYFCLKA